MATEKELQLNIVFFITLNGQEVARKPNEVLPSESAVKKGCLKAYQAVLRSVVIYNGKQRWKKNWGEIIEDIQGQNPPLPRLGTFRTLGQQLQCL